MDIFGVSISLIGIMIIALGWIFQLLSVGKKEHQLSKQFLTAYLFGLTLVVIDNYVIGEIQAAAANFVVFLLVLMVLLKTPTKEEKKTEPEKKKKAK